MTLRSRLVECLMRHSGHNDVNPLDEKVLSIMSHVPRHIFVPQELLKYAYANEALSLPCGQAISQPFVVAWMSSLLKLDTADNVLEIGTGSGYQTAILAEMAPQGRIVTFERYPELSRYARARIRQLTIRNVVFVVGDGTLGCPDVEKFDRIIVTAGCPSWLPSPLLEQLADGGILVAPTGTRSEQQMSTVVRSGDRLIRHDHGSCAFVPLVGEHGWH